MSLENHFKGELSPSEKVLTIACALADKAPYEILAEKIEEGVLSFILYSNGTPLHYTIGNNFAQNLIDTLNTEMSTTNWSDRIDTDIDRDTKTARVIINLNDLP